jgi:hypothetical protein
MISVARLAAVLWLTGAVCAHAAPDAEVESVQMPAWVERDGQRSPLEAGTVLRNGDHLETGVGSRALLRLSDGSTVKLGENARFELNDMRRSGTGQGVFKATLSVIEGAFRFTTAAIYKFSGRREIDVRFRTVTAGIRGTDLWGKSADDRDIVCLIEGHISVTPTGQAPLEMEQPQTVYQALKAGGSPPVSKVDTEQLSKWAAETEIAAGHGAARKGGKWRVFLMRARNGDDLADLAAQLAAAGYASRIIQLSDEGKPAYWIYVGNLPDRIEARALADKLRAQFKLGTVSISTQ